MGAVYGATIPTVTCEQFFAANEVYVFVATVQGRLIGIILEKVFRKYMSEEDIHNEDAENRGFIGGSQ